jgi:hypothetical protein
LRLSGGGLEIQSATAVEEKAGAESLPVTAARATAASTAGTGVTALPFCEREAAARMNENRAARTEAATAAAEAAIAAISEAADAAAAEAAVAPVSLQSAGAIGKQIQRFNPDFGDGPRRLRPRLSASKTQELQSFGHGSCV